MPKYPWWIAIAAVIVGTAPVSSAAGQPSAARPSSTARSSVGDHSPRAARQSPGRPRNGRVLWTGDFETGNLAQFKDAPWNFLGAPPPALVTEPVSEGRYAARIVLPPGVARAELVARDAAGVLTRGQVRYFAFSVYLPSDFTFSSGWRVFAQWKNYGTGSPPLQLALHRRRWTLEGGWNQGDCPGDVSDPRTAWTGRAERGRWTHFVVGVRFQEGAPKDPYRGWVKLWKDGVRVLRRKPWKSLYRGCSSYLKLGLYRDSDIQSFDVVGIDGWRMGTSYRSVSG